MKNIVVIGAGAAGLMAAITAAENGCKVTILEHKDTLGKKLGATGNGKCNFTNLNANENCYNSDNKWFVKYALDKFGVRETIDYFKRIGMSFVVKNDYVYPRSETAASVVEFFGEKCKLLGINIIYKAEVKKIIGSDNDFKVQYIRDDKRIDISANKVIIATGGKAAPKTGSDGSGYYFAKTLGHNVIEPVPGLVGLKVEEEVVKKMAGLRTMGNVEIYKEGRIFCQEWGEIQFTNYGISGIPVFQLSGYVARELLENKKIEGSLNFCLEMGEVRLTDYIKTKIKFNPNYSLRLILTTFFDRKILDVMFDTLAIDADIAVKYISDAMIGRMVNFLKYLPITVYDTNGFDNAQVCAGGVDTREVSPCSMESKIVKGVYFAGEVLDVNGRCGGYNLQWAWTSGRIAGIAVSIDT